jgi:deoxyribonuclease-4
MIGSHLSISGGMHNALLDAEKLGLDTVQVFTKNQQQWQANPLSIQTLAMFHGHAKRLGFTQIVAHDSYLINLAAVDPAMRAKSMAAFSHEMERCDELGISYLVTHPGAHVGQGEDIGIEKVVDAFNEIMRRHPGDGVTVCVETTAGQGSCLGWSFEHIARILNGIKRADRFGVCLDTCHVLAAGYDIRTTAGTKKLLDEFDRIIGLEQLKVFHLNDSKKALGTRVDRHTHLGRGEVGLDAFRTIMRDARFKNVPKILETPKEDAPNGQKWDEINIKILRDLATGKKVVIEAGLDAPATTNKKRKAK